MNKEQNTFPFIERLLDGAEVEWKSLGEVCEIKGRIGFRGYTRNDLVEQGEGAITLSPSNIINQQLSFENCSYISWAKYEESPEIKVEPYDVIFTKTASVGKTALVKTLPHEATINPQLVLLKRIKCKPAYLAYILQNNSFQQSVKQLTGQGSVPNVSQSALAKILIPLPPLSVQEEIVRILDKFTTLEAELEAELDCRKRQYEYYRNQLLSFDACEVDWNLLGNMAINCDAMRKPITSGAREKGNIPYYGASGVVDYVKGFIFDGDYLLVSEDGANLIARTTPIAFSIEGKSWVNNHAHVLKFDTYEERRFVEYYLNSIDLTPYISGAAQPKLNQKNLNKIKIPTPSFADQKRIVTFLDKFDTLTTSISEGLPKEIELRRKQYEYYRERLLSFRH